MPKIAILINNFSGGEGVEGELTQHLKLPENFIFEKLYFDPKNIKSLVLKLAEEGYGSILAAGGDGTVSAVAGAIVETNILLKFGILPVGTFNHFAKDLGIPTDLRQALAVAVKGNSINVDIAKVNNIYFINNSSLGIYPEIVKKREKIRSRGFSKGLALVVAAFKILRLNNSLSIEFESENNKIRKTTPFVFVGNNKYKISGLDVGERKRLDEGILSICIAKDVSRLKLFYFGFKALAGTLIADKDFNIIGLKDLTITSRKNFLDVSHDGEVVKMKPPLNYKILPKALNVIIP